MNKRPNPSLKRKRPDDEPQSTVPKSAKTSSVSDIQTIQPIVVTDPQMIAFDASTLTDKNSFKRVDQINNKAKSAAQCDAIQESSKKLKTEIRECVRRIQNSKERMNFIRQTQDDAEKMKRFLYGFKNKITKRYAPMVTLMAQKLTNIDAVRDMISSIKLDNQTFEREVELRNHELGKVNNDIDFVLRQREKVVLQKSFKIERNHKLAATHSQLKMAVEDESDHIKFAKCEEEANVRKLDNLKNQIEQIKDSISENAENYYQIQEEQATLTTEQENADVSLVDLIEKNKKLECELHQLKTKTKECKIQCVRIHQANHNLWNKEDREQSQLEFDEEYAARLVEKENMVTKVTELKTTVEKRNSQYNELKQIQAEMAEKEQHHAEVQSKLNALKMNILSRLDNISVTQKSINEMEVKLSKRSKQSLNFLKESAKAMEYSNDDDESMVSSISFEEFGLDSESESEMTNGYSSIANL